MKSTYQKTSETLKKANKKEVYDLIYLNANMVGGIAETIACFLKDCSTTFVKDIAEKYIKYNKVSEKQAWCMTFESIKIVHMIDAWIEKEIELSK